MIRDDTACFEINILTRLNVNTREKAKCQMPSMPFEQIFNSEKCSYRHFALMFSFYMDMYIASSRCQDHFCVT